MSIENDLGYELGWVRTDETPKLLVGAQQLIKDRKALELGWDPKSQGFGFFVNGQLAGDTLPDALRLAAGGVNPENSQFMTNPESEWGKAPRWRRRFNGFTSYLMCAVLSLLWHPEAVDLGLFRNLRRQFLEKVR